MLEILLIDDNPTQLRVREAVLCDAGFCVASATTAEEALSQLREPGAGSRFSVIVTDHVMPGDNGSVFVRQLRELHSHIPVLVVTGLPEVEEEYAGLNVNFLQKPCPPEKLIGRVKQLSGQQS
jgi:DNA-binding response OmpR family regulator